MSTDFCYLRRYNVGTEQCSVPTNDEKAYMNKVPENLPSTIGVYIFKTRNGEILYIGKSVNIKARVKSHFENAKLDLKERAIVEGSDKVETIATESEFKALILESSLIQKHRPKYNKIWMDDKSYLYVRFSMGEEYPKISLVRKSDISSSVVLKQMGVPVSSNMDSRSIIIKNNKEVGNDKKSVKAAKSLFFGPFSSRKTLENLLREIRKVIPFCTAKKITKTACFYSKIGLCNPCPNHINELRIKNLELRMGKNEFTNLQIYDSMNEMERLKKE